MVIISVQTAKLTLILVVLANSKVIMIQQSLHATLKGMTTEFKLENIQKS
jgi:hypothetical protein